MNQKTLKPEAVRALAEAQARRDKARTPNGANTPKENCSRPVEPTRYGDWEKKGIAYDF